ncbi:putative electron transfer flavoprotein subunit [Podila horticola]|nr:putative electron transfer flavoprotein subunit [Podila horticola]
MSNPSCTNCKTTLTPLWRKDDAGEILCNACGLYYKLHHRHRPISLKRNVIRHRSRYESKTPSPSATPVPVPVYASQAQDSLQDQASLQAQAQLIHAQFHAQQVHAQAQDQTLEWSHPVASPFQTSSVPS